MAPRKFHEVASLRWSRFLCRQCMPIIFMFSVIFSNFYHHIQATFHRSELRVAVPEWFSTWLVEQKDQGSIPGLATWIFRDWLSPASKSRYGWKSEIPLKPRKSSIQPTQLICIGSLCQLHRSDGIRLGPVFPSWLSDQMTGTNENVHQIEYCGHSLKNASSRLFSLPSEVFVWPR